VLTTVARGRPDCSRRRSTTSVGTPCRASVTAAVNPDAFDLLYTGRGLPADEVGRLLGEMAERAVCR
jgi:hypothetical protein